MENDQYGVIGAEGFLGKMISQYFTKEGHSVTAITRDNYKTYVDSGYAFDVLINCNGNSKKFWANHHPKEDFQASVVSVYNSLFDFNFNKYVYISSIDATHSNIYGFHKLLSETCIQKHCKDYIILRCAAIIDSEMKKGYVHDILQGNLVYVTPDSTLKVITREKIAKTMKYLIDQRAIGVYSVGSVDSISIESIGHLLDRPVKYAPQCRAEYYNDYTSFPNVTAESMLRSIL